MNTVDERQPALASRHVLGMRVDATSYDDAAERVARWAVDGCSRYVCVATVNNVMESHDRRAFQRVMNEADLVTPDGMPLVWALALMGVTSASRVYGPDLTPAILARAERDNLPVGFYGSSPQVLESLLQVIARRFPKLRIVYSYSPPFGPVAPEQDEQIVHEINESEARVLFVGLSTPKQDEWMSRHRGRVKAVMLGVGAAFDFLAGSKPQAPRWMMRAGLEWIFRLCTEPRRLWKRYLRHNPRFVVLVTLQIIHQKMIGQPK